MKEKRKATGHSFFKRYRTKQKYSLLIVLAVCALLLQGCSSTELPSSALSKPSTSSTPSSASSTPSSASPRSEESIIADIIKNDDFYSRFNLQVVKYNVTSRLTSTARMTDDIAIQVTSECDDFTFTAEYELKYLLYDNGWILDNFHQGIHNWVAKTGVAQSDVYDIVAQSYQNVKYISREDSDNSSILYYSASVPEGYISSQQDVTVKLTFNPSTHWTYSISDNTTGVVWDIAGEWTYNDGTNNIWINIIRVNSNTITLEYNMSYYNFGTWGDKTGNLSSNGAITVDYGWFSIGNYSMPDPYDIYVNLPGTSTSLWIGNNRGLRWCGVPLNRV